MSEAFLYLTTRGRTSGLPRTIEIWFVERAGRFYVVSEGRERAHWVQNVAREPKVTFSVGPREQREAQRAPSAATARALTDDAGDAETARDVSALMQAKYAWSDGLIVEVTPCGA